MSEGVVDACAGEVILSEASELLWRQVNPNHVDDGIVAAEAFVGTPDDRYRISTSRSSLQTAEGAYRFHTESARLSSAGTWGVTVGEAMEVGAGCVYDAESDCAPVPCPPGHTNVDIRGLARPEQRIARSYLAAKATERGRYHPSRDAAGD